MLTYLFYAFLAYLAFRLVFSFIIPVVRTTRQVKKGFRDMQERMGGTVPRQSAPQQSKATTPKPKSSDYIDFEEIKD